MKQLSALFLTLIYGILTIASGMQVHLCTQDDHKALVYQVSESDGCTMQDMDQHKCCQSKETSEKEESNHGEDDCCSDVQLLLVNELESVNISLPTFEENVQPTAFASHKLVSYKDIAEQKNEPKTVPYYKHFKPDKQLYLRHSSLVLYA